MIVRAAYSCLKLMQVLVNLVNVSMQDALIVYQVSILAILLSYQSFYYFWHDIVSNATYRVTLANENSLSIVYEYCRHALAARKVCNNITQKQTLPHLFIVKCTCDKRMPFIYEK